jgi:hypothetical protein
MEKRTGKLIHSQTCVALPIATATFIFCAFRDRR